MGKSVLIEAFGILIQETRFSANPSNKKYAFANRLLWDGGPRMGQIEVGKILK